MLPGAAPNAALCAEDTGLVPVCLPVRVDPLPPRLQDQVTEPPRKGPVWHLLLMVAAHTSMDAAGRWGGCRLCRVPAWALLLASW